MANQEELLKRINKLENENAELRTEQKNLPCKSILEEMPMGVGIASLNGTVRFLNKRFVELFGYSMEEIPTLGDWFPLAYPDEEYRDKLLKVWSDSIEESLQTGVDPDPIEARIQNKAGETLVIQVIYKVSDSNVITIFNDLTSEKEALAELDRAQKLLGAAIEQSPAGIIVADAPDVNIRLANAAALHIRGGDPEKLTQIEVNEHVRSWQTFYPDGTEFLAEDLPLSRAILKGEKSKNIELIIRNEAGEDRWVSANAAPVRNSKGQIIAGIVVFQDITANKQVEIQLLESKQMLRAVLDAIPVRVFWKNRESVYLGCNHHFANDANLNSVDDIIGKTDFDLPWGKSEAELFRKDDKEVIELNRSKLNYEEPQTHENNELVWLSTSKMPLRNHKGEIIGVMGTYEDVTDRKKAEDALIESERNYREIFNSSADAVIVHDAESGKILDVNNTMLQMFDCTYEEAIHSDPHRFSLGNDMKLKHEVDDHIEMATKGEIRTFRWLASKYSGEQIWVEITLKPILLNARECLLVVIRDISDRIEVEEAIAYRHSLEKLIFSISTKFINITVDDVDVNINTAFQELCRFTNTDSIYMYQYARDWKSVSLKYIWHEAHIPIQEDKFLNYPSGTDHWHFQQIHKYREVRVADISDLPTEASFIKMVVESSKLNSFVDVALFYQGNIIGFFGIASAKKGRIWLDDEVNLLKVVGDIILNSIQRKEALTALQDSEQTYREIYNATNEAIFIHEPDTGEIVDVNEAMLNMFGYSFEEAVSLNLADVTVLDENYSEERAIAHIRDSVDKPQVFEWHSKRSDGSAFWSEVSLRSAEIHGKKQVLAVVRDVHERKQALRKMQESEEKYRILVEGQSDLVVKVDTEGIFRFASPSYCELFDKTENELLGASFMPLVHEDDRASTAREMEKLFSPPYSCSLEQRAMTKFGWRWFSWKDKSVLDENNNVIEIVGVGRDITYQKEVEAALRESEDRFRTLIQQLSDMVLVLDENLVINFETPSAQSILGYAEGYMLGRQIADFIYADDLELFAQEMELLLNSKNNLKPSEFRVRHSSGQWVHLEIVGNNMLSHPAVSGLVITCRNITERKLLEKRILDAIIKTEEKERERFAKNLHDDLGPLLSSIKMYLGMFGTITDKAKSEFIVEQLNDIVKEAIVTTKDVSNDLSPHILNNYGLVSAVDSFLKKVTNQIKVDFINYIENNRYSTILETSIYRITKELINNTLKHAEATEISLLLKEEKSSLILNYTDNGKGLSEDLLDKNYAGGMGLSNIMSRSKSLNAVYEFTSGPGEGLNFVLKAPIVQE